MAQVTVYSTATCGYCKMLKGYLDSYDVEFEEKRADDDPNLAKELYELSGQLGVPFTVITNEDGSSQKILGFDRAQINEALDIG